MDRLGRFGRSFMRSFSSSFRRRSGRGRGGSASRPGSHTYFLRPSSETVDPILRPVASHSVLLSYSTFGDRGLHGCCDDGSAGFRNLQIKDRFLTDSGMSISDLSGKTTTGNEGRYSRSGDDFCDYSLTAREVELFYPGGAEEFNFEGSDVGAVGMLEARLLEEMEKLLGRSTSGLRDEMLEDLKCAVDLSCGDVRRVMCAALVPADLEDLPEGARVCQESALYSSSVVAQSVRKSERENKERRKERKDAFSALGLESEESADSVASVSSTDGNPDADNSEALTDDELSRMLNSAAQRVENTVSGSCSLVGVIAHSMGVELCGGRWILRPGTGGSTRCCSAKGISWLRSLVHLLLRCESSLTAELSVVKDLSRLGVCAEGLNKIEREINLMVPLCDKISSLMLVASKVEVLPVVVEEEEEGGEMAIEG
ncbi:hypothetical protein [Candidatus Ichthyocystis sparus]|uniref:hypothetical protein n=1 Tax=Candidatus Ichthyocystis sparus TaxID=1561004 RepID=UPI000B857BE3|nr:hypothetical protein [Candidatus Ichthyocystis sparus]